MGPRPLFIIKGRVLLGPSNPKKAKKEEEKKKKRATSKSLSSLPALFPAIPPCFAKHRRNIQESITQFWSPPALLPIEREVGLSGRCAQASFHGSTDDHQLLRTQVLEVKGGQDFSGRRNHARWILSVRQGKRRLGVDFLKVVREKIISFFVW